MCLDNGLFTTRVPRRNRERQHLGGRREETRGNATSSLVQSGRQYRDRRYDGFYLRGIIKHVAPCTLNDPTIRARAGKPHANCTADLGLVNELVRNNVVERPIHVGQIDVNEHTSDVRGPRPRRIETVKHALLGSHDPSESRLAHICVPLSAEKLQPVLRDHHGEHAKNDQAPQCPVEALCDKTTQPLGHWDDAIANIDASDSTKHKCCR